MNHNELPSSSGTVTRPFDRAAYVIHTVSSLVGTHLQSYCPDLDPDLAESLYEAVKPGRSDSYRRRDLWSFVENKAIPGVAIVDERLASRRLPTCRPIKVPFEPIPLDESHPTLVELAELSAGDDHVAPLRRGYFAPFRRYAVRTGLSASWTTFLVFQFIRVAKAGVHSQEFLAYLMLFVFLAAIPFLLLWAGSNRWLIIPGGVVVRAFWWRRGPKGLRRYTPATAMLFVAEKGRAWIAKLCDQDGVLYMCMLTQLECIALLGAWQCPLPPPDANKLVDLQ